MSKLKSNIGIRRQLIILMILISVIPLVFVTTIAYQTAKTNLQSAFETQLLDESSSTKQFIDNWFDYRWMDINREATNPLNTQLLIPLTEAYQASDQPLDHFTKGSLWHKTVHEKDKHLRSLMNQYDYLYDIFLVDLSGNILYTVEKEADFGTNLFVGDYSKTNFSKAINATINTGQTQFSDLERYAPSNNVIAGFISAPLLDEDGHRIGAIAFQIWVDRVQTRLTNKDYILLDSYIVGTDGILRTSPPSSTLTALDNTVEMDFLQQLKPGHTGIYTHRTGVEYLAVYYKVEIWNVTWYLVSEIPLSVAFLPVTKLSRVAISAVLVTLILAILFSVVASNRIALPILQLVDVAKRIRAGETINNIDISANNEVGLLADSFNSMLQHQQKVEDSLVREKERAIQSSKAKSQFLANMSHEIRTPMNGVLGMMNLLRKSKIDDSQKKKLEIAQASAHSLLAIINDILDFSKIESGKLSIESTQVNITKIIFDSVSSFSYVAEDKGIQLKVRDIELDSPLVLGDAVRITQILNNLLSNAIKFTQQGSVEVSARWQQIENTSVFELTVADSGIGIPEDKLDKLFNSFTQADNSTTRKFGGTGLGLAIAKALAKLMGGDLTVTSQEGIGSRFTFTAKLSPSGSSSPCDSALLGQQAVWIIENDDEEREKIASLTKLWEGQAQIWRDAQSLSGIQSIPDFVIINSQELVAFDKLISQAGLASQLRSVPTIILHDSIIHGYNRPIEITKNYYYLNKPVTRYGLSHSIAHIQKRLGSADEATQPSPRTDFQWPASLKIMLVEDNTINQEVAKDLLGEFQLQCDIADNGQIALDLLQASPLTSPYTMIFMDCQMPIMDGYTATKHIRTGKAGDRYRKVPIIAMTAHAMSGDRDLCIDSGMDDYVSKPIDEDTLLGAIRKWANISSPSPAEPSITPESSDIDTSEAQPAPVSTEALPIPKNLQMISLDHISPRLLNKPERYRKLLRLFHDNNKNMMLKMEEHWHSQQMEAITSLLHSVKGSAGNLALRPLYEYAQKLEKEVKAGSLAEDHIEHFSNLVRETLNEIESVINEAPQKQQRQA